MGPQITVLASRSCSRLDDRHRGVSTYPAVPLPAMP